MTLNSDRSLRGSPSVKTLVTTGAIGLFMGALHRAVGAKPDRSSDPLRLSPGVTRSARPAPAERPDRQRATPAEIEPAGWWSVVKRTAFEVNSDRVLAVAGGITYYSLLSMFPAVTVLVSLYGLFSDQEDIAEQLQMLAGFLPEGAMAIIAEQVTRIANAGETGLGLAAIGGLIVAMWSSNAAMKAMFDALNIAYDAEETRSFITLNLTSLAFTLSAILGLIIMIGLVAVIPFMLQIMGLGPVAETLISWGRWPLAFGLSILALAVLYRYGPCRGDVPWRWITPGSLLAAIGLSIFSMLFSWYAANFGKFNETYGSLGAVIGFMTWLWLLATIVLVGAEFNAEIENTAKTGGTEATSCGRKSARKS